jgi:hypothetical protein
MADRDICGAPLQSPGDHRHQRGWGGRGRRRGRRALIGVTPVLRSTFVTLMYLDGRYTDQVENVDERTGAHEERVVTWRLRDTPES